MKEISRRTFFKYGVTALAGVLSSEALIPVKIKINEVVTSTTGAPTGNAYTTTKNNNLCKDNSNPQQCAINIDTSPLNLIYGTILTPINEEFLFRANPSLWLSQQEKNSHPYKEILTGTENPKFTRRELLYGIISSLIFGLAHNITDQGIDIKTVPASITFSGMTYWYLQRRLGIFANVFAHGWHNYRALTWKT